MVSTRLKAVLAAACAALLQACSEEQLNPVRVGWSQWGQSAEHTGQVSVEGQSLSRILGEVVVDPFVAQERVEAGGHEHGVGPLLVHYQAPLASGDDVFIATKGGDFVACVPPGSEEPFPCGAHAWAQQTWREERWVWEGSALTHRWTFESDWKPVPSEYGPGTWEPVFHGALVGDYVVVPGAGGSLWVVDRVSGSAVRQIQPFGSDAPGPDDELYVVGPLTVDSHENIYYHVVAVGRRLFADAQFNVSTEAWLVRTSIDGAFTKATFASLVPGAPLPEGECPGNFRASEHELPWPPSPDAKPEPFRCGVQRPGMNIAPAVAPDGTIYTVSRADFTGRAAYLVAVNPNLSPKWASSLKGHLNDGCGTSTLPPNGQPGGCREGSRTGVDPATNDTPAGIVLDSSTASPVVTPEGSVLFGAYTRYNYSRGHLFHFNKDGSLRATYGFGWDVTPGIYAYPGGYSVVIKDNHYIAGSYCADEERCPTAIGGPFYITQLTPDLVPQWSYSLTNQQSCIRQEDGSVSCVADHPTGFEWCINAPAVDQSGVVYANGEDGVLYAIQQGGESAQALFLGESLGAAYTPLSIDEKGRVYTQNVGRLFVVGE